VHVHRGRRPLKELGKKIYKSGGDHYNKTKKGIKQKKKETLFWQKCCRFPPTIHIAFPLIHSERPT